jgi:hypothetical protein
VGGLFEVLLLIAPDPPLTDCDRFPPRPVAAAAMEFNRSYHRHVLLQQGIAMHHWWDWQDTLTETEYLYHCWEALSAAQGAEGNDCDTRRQGLERLRELLGEEAYYQGVMPPSVPVWRFLVVN